MPRGIPNKKRVEAETESEAPLPPEPVPVRVVREKPKNPYEGKFPKEGDPTENRKYRFTYNQQPGTDLEFTKGRTVLKANGMPGTCHESYKLTDGQECELPVDVAKHLNSLVYFEEGRQRPRCTLVEV